MAFTFKHGDRPLRGYQIQCGLGRGGFGEVYYAVSDGGREVALKYLHSHQEIELRGIQQCMNLKSPHLVSIFDVVQNDEGEYFVIMEYISGPSLRDIIIAEPQGLGVAKATFFFKEIAKGLSYLHERGIVHRDLKPGNIFYDEGYVKIGDYGLSKFISQSAAGGNTVSVGTLAYMAPEVGSGHYASSIDIYALGVVLYEMLVGRVPFEGQSAGEVLMKHLVNQPEVDNLPAPFAAVLRKALSKDPQDRYASVAEMAEAVLGEPIVSETLHGLETRVLARRPAPVRPAAASKVELPGAAPRVPFQGSSAAGPTLGPAAGPSADRERRVDLSAAVYAGFWIRVAAALVDLMVLSPFMMMGLMGPGYLVVSMIYGTLLVAFWDGQTVGKKACGIRVLSADGRPMTFWHALARELCRWLSRLTVGIGYVMAGFTRFHQGLHDLAASTVVVYAQSIARPPAPRDGRRGRRPGRWVEDRPAPPRRPMPQPEPRETSPQ